MSRFLTRHILFCCFDQYTVFIEETDSVVREQDKFSKSFRTRRCDNSSFLIVFTDRPEAVIIP